MKNRGAVLCGFVVSTMTFWKTLIYMIQYFDLTGGGHLLSHLNWLQYTLFMLPNSLWLVIPLYFILTYGKVLRSGLNNLEKNKTD